jgi:hypothetical protein
MDAGRSRASGRRPRRKGSSLGCGFMTCDCDLSAGHWAFLGVPRSALLCSFPRWNQAQSGAEKLAMRSLMRAAMSEKLKLTMRYD